MRYTFIQMKVFSSLIKKYRFSQEDLRAMENELMEDPLSWPVMAGTGGVRKMRFAPEASGSGKSGGFRVCYLAVPDFRHVHLLTLYAKNEAKNLTAAQRAEIAAIVGKIRTFYTGGN